jgi:hypothetical protein
MDNYTVTFVYDGEFDLPDDVAEREKAVPGMVLRKMRQQEFELVDFNLTQNYDHKYAKHYINDPYLHRSVVEITVPLEQNDLISRDIIYARCVLALERQQLRLQKAYENDRPDEGMLQSLIAFS